MKLYSSFELLTPCLLEAAVPSIHTENAEETEAPEKWMLLTQDIIKSFANKFNVFLVCFDHAYALLTFYCFAGASCWHKGHTRATLVHWQCEKSLLPIISGFPCI